MNEQRTPPHNRDAEASVVGQLLANPQTIGQVLATDLTPQHFYVDSLRRLYHEILSAYYADEPIDPVTIADSACAETPKEPGLATVWGGEAEVTKRVRQLASQKYDGTPVAHAKLVKKHADARSLLMLCYDTEVAVWNADKDPEEIAGDVSQTAMQIATSSLLTHEIVSFEQLGRNFIRHQQMLMKARKDNVELGAYFGLDFIDNFTRGLRPTELMFLGGPPGAGKSAVSWTMGKLFAERQMRKPEELRIGALMLSLEMGQEPSNVRVAQALTGLDGGKLREGKTSDQDLAKVAAEWGKRKDLPLYFNFTSQLRLSQLRALVVEAIRRYNIGLLVIDHFKYVLSDRRYEKDLQEDEEKARFLKENIAKDLNLAVICLAHTTKGTSEDGRPTLRDLRGSFMVAAHADFVGLVYRPYKDAKAKDIEDGKVKVTDAEMVWAKNRHGLEATHRFHFDPATMQIH